MKSCTQSITHMGSNSPTELHRCGCRGVTAKVRLSMYSCRGVVAAAWEQRRGGEL